MVLTCGKVIQGLNGTPDANSPNKAMSHNDRTITDINSKADVFINHYARVSKLNMSQSDCDTNRQFKKRLKVPSADEEREMYSTSNEQTTNCH